MNYDPEADSIDSHNDAILGMRCKHLEEQFEIAVKALLDIKRHASTSNGPTIKLAFITARDALIKLGRAPPALKRG